MLMKCIEPYIYYTKDTEYPYYTNVHLEFDNNINTLNISDDYLNNDFEKHAHYINEAYGDIIKRHDYESIEDINADIMSGKLRELLIITYCTDISKCDSLQWQYHDKVNTLEDLDKYCSGVGYSLNPYTKEIKRYEIYGDIYLGDYIERPISYYKSKGE